MTKPFLILLFLDLLVSFEFRHLFILFIVNIIIAAFVLQHCHWRILKLQVTKNILLISIGATMLYPMYGFCNSNIKAKQYISQIDFITAKIPAHSNIAFYQHGQDFMSTLSLNSDIKVFGLLNAYTDTTALLNALSVNKIDFVLIPTAIQNTHFYYKSKKPNYTLEDMCIYECK